MSGPALEFEPAAVLADAAKTVLETMFFTCVEEEAEDPEDVPALCAAVEFGGTRSGRVDLSLPEDCSRRMAADFLGVDPPYAVSAEQVSSVLRELVNMIGGAALSRLDSHGCFQLASPETIAGFPPAGGGVEAALPLDGGTLRIRLLFT